MPNGDKPIVKCSVSNCTFWGENNFCQAEAIMIDIDQHATKHYGAEFAGNPSIAIIKTRQAHHLLHVVTHLGRNHRNYRSVLSKYTRN